MRPQRDASLISVVIPSYNYGEYLGEAIESVLAQTYQPIEIVVVDDGSTDRTAEVAKSFPSVIYVYQANQGNSVARNTGLEYCSGAYVSLLDADDIWPAKKCQIQIDYLREHPEVGCVISRMRNFMMDGCAKPEWMPELMMSENCPALSLSAMLARREVFEKIGGFNLLYWHGNDLDWFIRVKEAGIQMAILPDILLLRRIHGKNESWRQNVVARERVRILKASMDRKRGIASVPVPGIR